MKSRKEEGVEIFFLINERTILKQKKPKSYKVYRQPNRQKKGLTTPHLEAINSKKPRSVAAGACTTTIGNLTLIMEDSDL